MIRSRDLFLLALCFLMILPVCDKSRKSPDGEVIRVDLVRDDSEVLGIWHSFEFDEDEVAKILEEYPVTLPEPSPERARLGLFRAGPVYGLFEKLENGSTAKLSLDANMNFDLTDDDPILLTKVEDREDSPIVKIARTYVDPEPHTEWLPYRLTYREDKTREGQIRESLSMGAHYTFKGTFELGGILHEARLYDGDTRGRFDKEKAVNVTIRVGPKKDMDQRGALRHHRPFELVPLQDALYEIRDIAEDGSWIEFGPSGLKPTSLGKAAPDFEMTDTEGETFLISEYRGKVVLLDFWYVWCKPCIAKFPAIKKMIEKFADRPFAAIGVNIDVAERVEQAKEIIAAHELTWRQVVEGRGEFIPVYQIYGRLPERPMSFPIYVAVDEKGVTRYATNDFEKMGRFLEAHFNDPEGPNNTLFIPLASRYGQEPENRPVNSIDFTSSKVRDFEASGKLKMPGETPPGARPGLLSNGIPLIAYPAPEPGKFCLVFDSNNDFDLNGEETHEISVVDAAGEDVSEESKTMIDGLQLHYQNGAIGFLSWPFFARRAEEDGDWPKVFFEGQPSRFEGSFFAGKQEYSLEITDSNGDYLLTDDDTLDSGFLKLKLKKKGEWIEVHKGIRRIPIGKTLYRLRHVSDDGYLVELEKEEKKT